MTISKHTCKVGKANSHGNSLKCTIPQQVATALNITYEDSLKWIIQEEDEKITVTVEKLLL